jgi:N-acetylmuramic acid 6-phosphate etherase
LIRKQKSAVGLLVTEQPNPASDRLDEKSALQLVRIINREDAKVARAVCAALPQIAQAVEAIADRLRRGGRLIYVGAGTSGRLGALDAAECPPTFGTDPRMVQFIMAGGSKALGAAVEANEDSRALGQKEIARRKPTKNDVVVGLAASGRTPFTVAAVEYARKHGAGTIAITCNPGSPLARAAQIAIVTPVGPEVIAGSTRMKAGTAQKMVLNMLSTGAMTRLGYVYSNLMVNLHPKNKKLLERALGILERAAEVDHKTAAAALSASGNSVSVALVMLQTGKTAAAARRLLDSHRGHARRAIQAPAARRR